MRLTTRVDVTDELDTTAVGGCDLERALEADPRFRRDSFLGGIFHPGQICFREISPTNSLHVIIAGERISAHVDEISPLVLRSDGSRRYAWGRVIAHNLLVLMGDVSRRLRGQAEPSRCDLHCQIEWFDDEVEAA
jgi:hypothetical protein